MIPRASASQVSSLVPVFTAQSHERSEIPRKLSPHMKSPHQPRAMGRPDHPGCRDCSPRRYSDAGTFFCSIPLGLPSSQLSPKMCIVLPLLPRSLLCAWSTRVSVFRSAHWLTTCCICVQHRYSAWYVLIKLPSDLFLKLEMMRRFRHLGQDHIQF
jgi:hypothetical protein